MDHEETVTIPRKEYESLKQKAEDYDFLIEWRNKKGARFEELLFLRDFDRYEEKIEKQIAYVRMRENYRERMKLAKGE